MAAENSTDEDSLPLWEQALRGHAATAGDDLDLFDDTELARELMIELGLQIEKDVRLAVTYNGKKIQDDLAADVKCDEYRALLVGAFAWLGLGDTEATREQYVSYAKAARRTNPEQIPVELNRRTYRETWAAFEYSRTRRGNTEHSLIRSTDYNLGRSPEFKVRVHDAFVAFLYALVNDNDDPVAYWDVEKNELRRTPLTKNQEQIPPDEPSTPVPITASEPEFATDQVDAANSVGTPYKADDRDDGSVAGEAVVSLAPIPPNASTSRFSTLKLTRRKVGWFAGIAAVVIAGIVTTSLYLASDKQNLQVVPLTEDDLVELSGGADVERPWLTPPSYTEVLAEINAEHCNNLAPNDSADGSEVLSAWGWQGDSCLTSSLLVDEEETFGVWISYQNRTEQQADDVTIWLELPRGFVLVPNSTYWAADEHRNGNFTTSNLTDPGINLGSFGTKANAGIGAQIMVSDARYACEGRQRIQVFSISNHGRDTGAQPQSDATFISCKSRAG